MGTSHPSLHAYANLKCRCGPCVTMWNRRYRVRARAAARLIEAHRDEFEAYLAAEATALMSDPGRPPMGVE